MKDNNTYITYDQLFAMVNDYFRMTGGEDFISKGTLELIINISIQDIINNSGFSFMSEFELLQNPKDHLGRYNMFYVKNPINVIYEIFKDGQGESLEVVNHFPYMNSNQVFFRKGTNILYVNKNIEKLSISYEKAYKYKPLGIFSSRDENIPIPLTHVPALIKMIYDNSSLYTFFQGDGAYTDFFGHAQSRLNQLSKQDILSYNNKINLNT